MRALAAVGWPPARVIAALGREAQRADHFATRKALWAAAGRADPDPPPPHPNRLRAVREARGLSQAALGAQVGVSHRAIGLGEGGPVVPALGHALALARALGVTVEELFGEPAAPGP